MHREALTASGLSCECWDRNAPDPKGPCGKPAVARWYGGRAPMVEGDLIDPVDQIPWASLACEEHDREMRAEAERLARM